MNGTERKRFRERTRKCLRSYISVEDCNVAIPTINEHLKKIFSDNELEETSVIRNFRTTASDGKTYGTKHYNLKAIIAAGYKVNSERAVQFRKWATNIIEEFTVKAYVMDDEAPEVRQPADGQIL